MRRNIILGLSSCFFMALPSLAASKLNPEELAPIHPKHPEHKSWKMTWNDEFDYPNSQLDETWISQNSPSGSFVICSRWRENVDVRDGVLYLEARKENRGGQEWTAGSIWTKRNFKYGYFECRYKYAGATGTNNSFWTWHAKGVKKGEKKFELDINEGHYPNEINTNIHSWSDKDAQGKHPTWQEAYAIGSKEAFPSYSHVLKRPVKARKIRFVSNSTSQFHIGELKVYAPSKAGYPKDLLSPQADQSVKGLINWAVNPQTKVNSSGQFEHPTRNTDAKNVADGKPGTSWFAPAQVGDKWVEMDFGVEREIGALGFTNGWKNKDRWMGLVSEYRLEYYDGKRWRSLADYEQHAGEDFSKEYHTYGMLWDEQQVSYYFDGKLLRTFKHTEITAPTHIYLSLAILKGGIAGLVTDEIDGTSMKVDYVRYYERK